MNHAERLHRLGLELLLFLAIFCLLELVGVATIETIVVTLAVVHTLSWLFNGHFFVLQRYLYYRPQDPIAFHLYIAEIYRQVVDKPYLLAVVAFGSIAQGKFRNTSDFDVRLIPRPGATNIINTLNLCTLQRNTGILSWFSSGYLRCWPLRNQT